MNKKLISAVLSVAMLIGGIGVFAENTSVPRDTITGIATDNENAVFAWNNDSALILNGYDKETGKLAASEVFYAKDGTVTGPVSTLEKYNFRAYSIENDQVYDVAVKTEATEPHNVNKVTILFLTIFMIFYFYQSCIQAITNYINSN